MKQNRVRLSLIIPAYNEEQSLALCLDSVAAQTIQPYEVIVIDNNSTDNTREIAQLYSFVTLLHEPLQGIVYARNRGFNAATGDVIGRTDADVVLPPDWVSYVTDFYSDQAHANNGLTGNGLPNNFRFARTFGWMQGQIAFRMNRFLLGHYIFFGSNMALPVNLWFSVRDELCMRTDIHEDLDLAIHANRAGYSIHYHEDFQVIGRAARVITNRDQLFENLMMWPKTLQVHNIHTWIFGWLGAIILYILSPIPLLIDILARFFHKDSIGG